MDLKEVGKFAENHWPYIAIGSVALIGMFYAAGAFGGGSSTATTPAPASPAAAGTDPATIQAQAQVALQSIITQGQVAQATILANAQDQQAAITANANAYETQTNAFAQTTQILAGTASGQNVQESQALASGFSNYILGTAQEVSAAAGSVATTAASNNSAAGNTISKTLTGAAALVSAWSGGAFGSLGSIAFSALANGTTLPSYSYAGSGYGGVPLGAVQVVPSTSINTTAGSGNALFARTPNALLSTLNQ